MIESVFLFVGAIGIISTIAAVLTRDNAVAIMAGVLGFITWGLWAFGAFNIETVTNTGTIVTHSYAPLAYFGILLALVPGYIALTGPVDIINRARQPDAKDL